MNEETRFAYQVRLLLNQGADRLDRKAAIRLHEARQKALRHQKMATGLRLAGIGHGSLELFPSYLRTVLAAVAILMGVAVTYTWNQFEQATLNEEIDSALLADDLPPNAYLDRGFQVWLERARQSQE